MTVVRRTLFGLFSRRPYVATYCAALVVMLFAALSQPVPARSDELAHFDFVAQIASGRWPRVGTTTIRPETARLRYESGVFGWNSDFTPPPETPVRFDQVPGYLAGPARALWIRRHIWYFSYEDLEAPLFYVAAVPFWKLAAYIGGPWGALVVLRVLNAFAAAAMAVLALAIAAIAAPGRRSVAVSAAALATVLPGFAFIGTQATNDTLMAALSGAALLLALRRFRRGWTPRSAAGLGLIYGAALLTKVNALALAPALGVCLLLPAFRARNIAAFGLPLVAAAFAAVTLLPWLALNWSIYGQPLPLQASASFSASVHPWALTPSYPLVNAASAFASYWIGEPLQLTLRAAWPFVVLMTAALPLLVTGTYWLLSHPPAWVSRSVVWILVLAASAAFAEAIALPVATHGDYFAPGRYTWSALAPGLVLAALALEASLPHLALRRASAGVIVVAAALAVVSLSLGGWVPHRIGYGEPGPQARRLAAGADGSFGGVRVAADEVAIEPAGHGSWVHVEVRNSAAEPADWDPMPQATDARSPHEHLADAVYAASYPFSSELRAGEAESGWIYLPVAGSRLGGRFDLTFHDIATRGYRQIGDLVVAVAAS